MEKIALIGTHGTGKTTLAHELVAALKKQDTNAEFLGEIARMCPLPINENTTREAQEWIMYTQYTKELENNKNSVLVCDRSVLDGYVYYFSKFGENKLLESFVKEKIKDYSHLFRIPINALYLKSDGIRTTDLEFQKKIDEGFDYLLNKFSIKYYTTRDLDEMVRRIQNGTI